MKKHDARPGDYVEVHLTRKIYEGTLLETSESDKGIILLKLNSGYNIGINKKDILEIKVLNRGKEEKSELKIKSDSKKPNIAMIITGGTIAARLNPKRGGVDYLEKPEDLFKYYPGVFDKVNVSKLEIPFTKGSEDMDFKDWQKLAKTCKKLLDDPDIQGIVITHGTDTLHFTSAALSFFLRDLTKPVVLTFSQRSIDRASSDANLNLQCAAVAATSDIAEVMIVGHASTEDNFCYALPGTKVRKLHSSRRDAFKVVNGKPYARVFPDRIEVISDYNSRKKGKGKVKLDFKFEEKVALVKVFPGQDPDILDYYAKKKYKGIVLEVFGMGFIPTVKARNNWMKKIKEVVKKGIVICAAAQTIYGRIDPFVYSSTRDIEKAGVIYLEDMLSEVAFVKLGWVLGHKGWNVKEKMLENVAREFSDRLEN